MLASTHINFRILMRSLRKIKDIILSQNLFPEIDDLKNIVVTPKISIANTMLSVVVPAYNEEARLAPSLIRMLAFFDAQSYPYEMLVVDDGSSDGTADVVTDLAAVHLQLRLLTYQPNKGKGHAVRYGMLRAVGERVLFCDADLATPIEEVDKLIAALDLGADIAIGSRDVPGSQLIKRQSIIRELGGRLINKWVQLFAVPGIHDTQCGFKLFTRAAAQSVFRVCRLDNFAFDVEVLYIAIKRFGLKVVEVPIRWAHQEGSKVRPLRDGWRMITSVLKIRFTRYEPAASAAEIRLR